MSDQRSERGERGDGWGLGVALALAGACLTALFAGDARAELMRKVRANVSPVIFPPQTITLRFSHQTHLKGMGLGCTDCHVSVTASASGADRNLPAENSCTGSDCHAIDRASNQTRGQGQASGQCVLCHAGFDPAKPDEVVRTVIPTPNLKFSHQVHAQKQVRCVTCHGDMTKVELGTRKNLPTMTTCLGCHDGRKAPSECTTCHLKLPDGRLRTDLPDGKLEPTGQIYGDAHDLTFRTEHARVAQGKQRYCESCHQKDFCSSCHSGVVKPSGLSVHTGDYLSIHGVDARKNNPTCDTCHKRQTFCVGCHQRTGVGYDRPGAFAGSTEPGGRAPAYTFHPDGWADRDRRGPNHHSWQAQRNLRTCASCHRETFCTGCHVATTRANSGIGTINPHPRGWRGSGFCKSLAKRNPRMCIRCHDPVDANGVPSVDADILSCR